MGSVARCRGGEVKFGRREGRCVGLWESEGKCEGRCGYM